MSSSGSESHPPSSQRPISSQRAVYVDARGTRIAIDRQLLLKHPHTPLARWARTQPTSARDTSSQICLDIPPRQLRNLLGYLDLQRPPATLEDGELTQVSRDAALLGVSDYIHVAQDIADARRQAQSWCPGDDDEPTPDQLQAQYTLSDILSQTGRGQESTALFLTTCTAEDHFLKTVGITHYSAIVHDAPTHARALSRMAHIKRLYYDHPHPDVLSAARRAVDLAPHNQEGVLVLAQVLLRSESVFPVFQGKALARGAEQLTHLCRSHAYLMPSTAAAQHFTAALTARAGLRRAVLSTSDSGFEEIGALAIWLQHEVMADMQTRYRASRRVTPELGRLTVRYRMGLNAWTGESIRGPLRLARLEDRPQLACCAWLQQMAFAQEGLTLLRAHVDAEHEDPIGWSLLAQHCLGQQLYRDSLMSLTCLDDACAPAASAQDAPVANADAGVTFGASGVALYQEGIAALSQALVHAEHAVDGVQRQVGAALLSYADLACDLGRPGPPSDTLGALHAQVEADFLRWAPHYTCGARTH